MDEPAHSALRVAGPEDVQLAAELHHSHEPKRGCVLCCSMGCVVAGVANAALLWTESRRELEVSIHKEKTRDHENWEPDVLSQVSQPCPGPAHHSFVSALQDKKV